MKTKGLPSWATPCHECRGEGETYDQWSPNMWLECTVCFGMGTVEANRCQGYHCQGGKIMMRPDSQRPEVSWRDCATCKGDGWLPRNPKLNGEEG